MKTKGKKGFKGQYCTGCNTVWEVLTVTDVSGMEVKYPDFPSYGLERQACSGCKGISPGSVDTLPTLAQKAAKEHQELIDRLKNKATVSRKHSSAVR